MAKKFKLRNDAVSGKLKDSLDVAMENEKRKIQRVKLLSTALLLLKGYQETEEEKEKRILLTAIKSLHYQKWFSAKEFKLTDEKFAELMKEMESVPLILTKELQDRQ